MIIMQENSKYASRVTYSPREASILKAIDETDDKKYPSKNEIFRRGLHCSTYLWNVNENSQFNLLHSLLENLSKDLDKQTLSVTKDLAFSIQSVLVIKYGLEKADSFATIPITLENLSNSLEEIDTITDEIKTDVKKTITDLDTSLQTIFLESDNSTSKSLSNVISNYRNTIQRFIKSRSDNIKNYQINDTVFHFPSMINNSLDFTQKLKVLLIDDDVTHQISDYLKIKDIDVIDQSYDLKNIPSLSEKDFPVVIFNIKKLTSDVIDTIRNIHKFSLQTNIIVLTTDFNKETTHVLKELNTHIVYMPHEQSKLLPLIQSFTSGSSNLAFIDSTLLGSALLGSAIVTPTIRHNLGSIYDQTNFIDHGIDLTPSNTLSWYHSRKKKPHVFIGEEYSSVTFDDEGYTEPA